jgi:hypothetical protein
MTRKLNAASVFGQHLSLAVAAHLARSQLVPDPLEAYDSQHRSEMLNFIALALARTAPLYVLDAAGAEPRQLAADELGGAVAKGGASVLVLKDGRSLAGVSMRRADLRQAIAILKTIGLQEIAPQLAPALRAPPAPPKAEARPPFEVLLERLARIEQDLRPPLLPAQVDRARACAVFIARRAPHGRVANLAMQLMSALYEPGDADDVAGGYRVALARLRAALEDHEAELQRETLPAARG